MTHAQYERIKNLLNQKWQSGEIHADEYFGTLDLMDQDPDLGAAEASRILGVKIAPDPGERAAKRAEAEIEKKIKSVYGTAAKELKEKLGSLEKGYAERLAKKQKELAEGKITQDELKAWVRSQLLQQKQVKDQIDQCTGVLLHANEKALGIVNQEQLGVFAENANFQEYQINQDTGLNLMFSVYDEHSVERLIRDNPDLLPPKMVNGKKDKAWNQTRITSAVTQAIIQGESIPKLAKRIAAESAGGNAAAMMRYARTAMTAAQNAGRVEMLHRAQSLGVKCRKRWMATLDSRTRDSHQEMDGEVVGVDDEFSNGLLYPGDPNGAPGEVYNCRCTMTYEYDGIDNALQERMAYNEWDDVYYTTEKDKLGREYQKKHVIHHRTGEMIEYQTYSEWKKQNAPVPEKKQEPRKAEKQPRKAAVDKLSQETRDAIEMYTAGEEFHLDQEQLDEIAEAMEETDKPLYRVETGDRTATDYNLDIGDEFDFSQQIFESKDPENGALRSFTRSTDALPDLVGQIDDAVIYRTSGPVEQLPVDTLSQYDQAESLAFGNGWKVTGRDTMVIDGKKYTVIDIQQVRSETEKTASGTDERSELEQKLDDIASRHVVQGKDITGTWQRRPDEFAFEIEDVINAQGFDGLPRIMDADDFDKAVKESGFIAQRTYSAPDQETLDIYQDQLYNGKWYVDCSTGGAHFGQGMYCTGSDGEKLTQEIKDTMNYYSTANETLLTRKEQESKSEMAQRNRQYIEKNYSISPEHIETVEKLVYGRLDGTLPKQEDFTLYRTLTGEEKRQLAKITEDMKTSGMNQPRMVKRNEPVSTIETITLTQNAKTISWSALEKEYNESGMQRHKDMDIGAYAAMKGYDAVTHIPNTLEGNPEIDVLILNRTKCIFRRDN